MRFVQQLTIRVINCDDGLRTIGSNAEERVRCYRIRVERSNCSKTNVLISLLESSHGVSFENIFEIVATAEISIFGEFVVVDQ